MANNNYTSSVKMLGIPDKFIHHGMQDELHKDCYYDTDAIIKSVHEILSKSLVSQVG